MRSLALAVFLVSTTASAADVNYSPIATPAKMATPTTVDVADTDHEATRLRPGIGYFGRIDAPLDVPLHQVGMRLWFRRRLGLDLSVGANLGDKYAVGGRVALPIGVLVEPHLTLYVAPTIGYAYANETIDGKATTNPITGLSYTPPDARSRAMLFTGGLRVGGELQLGGIGLARVALFGAIGLDADYARTTVRAAPSPSTRDPEPRAAESTDGEFALRTTFLTNLGAVFYF